ncbi:hypothetical protein J7E70_22690 [Variovorax paradoxus]|nr:hypothetical protein [Variovorax paradoxus]MBT2303260.1 hypothetical protein [Variovorax paradoxus]
MRTVKFPKASRGLVALALASTASLFLVTGVEVEAAPTKIAFRLDPRVTYGRYMGDRWVTPTTFTQVQQFQRRLQVAARSHDVVGWTSNDASMVTVTPSVGNQVTINVNRAGQTTVVAGAAVLTITARQVDNGVLQVQIRQ